MDNLSVTERLVASVIHGFSVKGRPCFMTNAGFGKLLRVSRRTASAAVNRLIDLGLIEELGGGDKRTLGWKNIPGGVEASLQGGWKQASNRNKDINQNLNLNHNGMDDLKRPIGWHQVRDYFQHLDDKDRVSHRGHLEPWAKDFMTYYEARGWKNKHGDITEWRPVALAWYNRSRKNVPQRAVKKFDAQKVRDDIRWHRRRYQNYERADKAEQAHRELMHIKHLEQQLAEWERKTNDHADNA